VIDHVRDGLKLVREIAPAEVTDLSFLNQA